MTTLRPLKMRIAAAGALLAVALLVAACGGSSSKTTNNNTTGAAAASTGGGSSGGSTRAVSISTASGSVGAHLVGASGRAIYLWEADHGNKSTCSGACAQAWPPVTSKAAAKAAGAAKPADLGTTTRKDGTKQVTYKGHPLYYFFQDTAAGQTNGQGSNAFGAKWWLVTPAGTAITSTGSSQATQSSSSGYSSSGY